eukprot:4284992-Alexandrium_andersonii.AAC.1
MHWRGMQVDPLRSTCLALTVACCRQSIRCAELHVCVRVCRIHARTCALAEVMLVPAVGLLTASHAHFAARISA